MLLGKITIGSSIESLVYAFLNDTYYLPTSQIGPLFYEKINYKFLKSDRADFTWSRLHLFLSLSGKLLNYEKISNIKVTENLLKIASDQGTYKYSFNTCYIFEPTGIQLDNEIKKEITTIYDVYDDFEISNLGGKHKYLEPKISEDSLAKQIHYYVSDRVDGADYVTDCVVQSCLTKEEINDVEYSDSLVRFAVSRHLTSIGIHGNFMNMYKNGSPKYRKPKIIHNKRIVLEREQNEYFDSESIKFLRLSFKEIFNGFSTKRS